MSARKPGQSFNAALATQVVNQRFPGRQARKYNFFRQIMLVGYKEEAV